MININLVCVGNLKEKFSKEAQAEYVKRLSSFCSLKIVEIKEQNQLQNPVAIVQKEGVDIVKNLKGYVILCDIKGKELSSEKLSEKIKSIMMLSSTITIVVGGSYGVSEEEKKLADEKISFSPMTFPHNLFRIMLLEQIYRAFTIIENKSYHK